MGVTTIACTAYLAVGILIGFRMSVIHAWRIRKSRQTLADAWWVTPAPLGILLGLTCAWPVCALIVVLRRIGVLGLLVRPPKEIREQALRERQRALEEALLDEQAK